MTPQQLFSQGFGEHAGKLKEMVKTSEFRTAVAFAMSQMAWQGNSREQLDGARKFVETLVSLGETGEPLPPFPDKQLRTL